MKNFKIIELYVLHSWLKFALFNELDSKVSLCTKKISSSQDVFKMWHQWHALKCKASNFGFFSFVHFGLVFTNARLVVFDPRFFSVIFLNKRASSR